MNFFGWNTIQQLVRIIAYAVGGFFLGDAVTQNEPFQAAVAGLVAIAAFIWWLIVERHKTQK